MFWDRGYQGASISALTAAMGIGSPSLYAAFGSKAKLFQEATDLYLAEDAGRAHPRLLASGDDRPGVGRSDAAIERRPVHPRGRARRAACSPGRCRRLPDDDPEVSDYLDASVEQRIRDIEVRLERGAADGEELPCLEVAGRSPSSSTPSSRGMAVRSIEGASRASLHRIVDLTMRIWDIG